MSTSNLEVHEGKIEFRNAYGLKLHPAPERSGDLEVIEHWLRITEPGFDRDGNPQWDGSRMDLDDVLSWMRVAEKTRAHARG